MALDIQHRFKPVGTDIGVVQRTDLPCECQLEPPTEAQIWPLLTMPSFSLVTLQCDGSDVTEWC
eukprot:SAG22_NODE_1308_length_4787_cov_3.561860_6_plen_64_part_00